MCSYKCEHWSSEINCYFYISSLWCHTKHILTLSTLLGNLSQQIYTAIILIFNIIFCFIFTHVYKSIRRGWGSQLERRPSCLTIINSSHYSLHVWRVTGVFHCRCVWPHSKFSVASRGVQFSSLSMRVHRGIISRDKGGFPAGLGAISNGFNLCGWKFASLDRREIDDERVRNFALGNGFSGENVPLVLNEIRRFLCVSN